MMKKDTRTVSRNVSTDNSKRSQSRDRRLLTILHELLTSRSKLKGTGQQSMTPDVSKLSSLVMNKDKPPLPPKMEEYKRLLGSNLEESTQCSEQRITRDFFRRGTPTGSSLPMVEHPGSEYNKENNQIMSNKQLPPMYPPRKLKSPQKATNNSSFVMKKGSNIPQDNSTPILVRSNSLAKKQWKLPTPSNVSTNDSGFGGNRSKTPLTDLNHTSNQQISITSQSVQHKSATIVKFKAIVDRSRQVSGKNNLQNVVSDLPRISAKFWVVFDHDTCEPLFGYKHSVKREIASLTKIATLFTALKIIEEEKIDIDTFECVVTYNASSKIGTSAYLKLGDRICLRDLLYGKFSADVQVRCYPPVTMQHRQFAIPWGPYASRKQDIQILILLEGCKIGRDTIQVSTLSKR